MPKPPFRASLKTLVAFTLVVATTSKCAAQDGDWPRFRGPSGQGVSSAKNLPLTWSQKENIVWKTPLPGPGSSSPVIAGDKIYLTCFTGYVPGNAKAPQDGLKLHVVCLDRETGKILWTNNVTPKLPEQAVMRENHGYASSTPIVDGERIYVHFGASGAFAFDLKGNQIWQANVGSKLDGFGSGASPIVYKNLLIVNASVESESLIALDTKSGKETWRARGIPQAWNTPALVPLKDGKVELVVGIPGKVLGFDPATGQQLWSCANDIVWYIVPSIVSHDGNVWSLGGRSGILAAAVRAGGRGDVTKTHRLWTSKVGSNVASPIIHDGHLYWMNDSNGIAYCAEAMTGKLIYEERVPRAEQIYASPILAEGRIYYLSRSGQIFVLPAAPKYEVLAVNEVGGRTPMGDRSMFNATPAAAGNALFVRSDQFLYRIGRK
jgi:outer membrane protein assembly factor BamB